VEALGGAIGAGGHIKGIWVILWSRSLEVNNRLRGDILEPS
jgi:hypothetical protein